MSETETNGTVTPPQEKINNYLVPAIISTVCCCIPCGIVSIIFATQVNTKLNAGDIAGAKSAAGKAKMWMFIGVGLGLVSWVLSILLNFVLPLIIAAVE